MSPNETAQNLTSKKKVQAEKLVRFIRALLSKNKKNLLGLYRSKSWNDESAKTLSQHQNWLRLMGHPVVQRIPGLPEMNLRKRGLAYGN